MSDRCACGCNDFMRRAPDEPYACMRCGAHIAEEGGVTLDDVVQRLDRIIELLMERRNER